MSLRVYLLWSLPVFTMSQLSAIHWTDQMNVIQVQVDNIYFCRDISIHKGLVRFGLSLCEQLYLTQLLG